MPPTTYRILVLDDDPVMLDLTTAFLSLASHQVTAVPSSDQAFAIIQANSSFDLVLTDLNMPGLEGQDLARALRAVLPAHVSLAAMSATQPSTETQSLFDAFIPKPFDPQTLQDTIANTIESRATDHSTAPAQPSQLDHAEPVLDDAILQSLAKAIPPPQLRKLYDMGIGDIEKRLARIHEAVALNDLSTVKREAHAIKGSCGMVGARELQALATAIEDGTTLDTSAIEQIPEACRRLRRMLDGKLQAE